MQQKATADCWCTYGVAIHEARPPRRRFGHRDQRQDGVHRQEASLRHAGTPRVLGQEAEAVDCDRTQCNLSERTYKLTSDGSIELTSGRTLPAPLDHLERQLDTFAINVPLRHAPKVFLCNPSNLSNKHALHHKQRYSCTSQ